jgi:putative Holliday junction resolvase
MSSSFPGKGVLLGVDFGQARIGLARCDGLRMLASPLIILQRKKNTSQDDADCIISQMEKYQAVALVMGWPDEDDERTDSIRKLISRCLVLLEKKGIPLVRVSESFSSREALELLHAVGKKKKPGQYIDDWAAAVILQRYLDFPDEYIKT